MGWRNLSFEERDNLLKKKLKGKSVATEAERLEMPLVTLERRLREWRQKREVSLAVEEPKTEDESILEDINSDYLKLFKILKKGPVSLRDLSLKFDRSEHTIFEWIQEMEDLGYAITKTQQQKVFINTVRPPKVDFSGTGLTEEEGVDISFAVVSDTHAGSTHSQPSAIKRFLDIAYNEYGVRHVIHPGDLTTGVGGYRGQELDIVEAVRPRSRNDYYRTIRGEVWLADKYLPQYEDLRYYILGGNHDYWGITNAGIDPVKLFTQQRDDAEYLGYDSADIPLTDKVSARIWHPTGGVPYALSYKLQKGMEQVMSEELGKIAVENEETETRRIGFLIAGHLHVQGTFQIGPVMAVHPGCFEGKTNLLKRLGKNPSIGGMIFKIRITKSGLVQRVEPVWIPFYSEIIDDWKNHPLPDMDGVMGHGDQMETLFEIE